MSRIAVRSMIFQKLSSTAAYSSTAISVGTTATTRTNLGASVKTSAKAVGNFIADMAETRSLAAASLSAGARETSSISTSTSIWEWVLPPPVIWAAEEDDWDIEQQLIARPRKRIERTYPREMLFDEPEVVLTRPEVRESLPSVELDTITFGFNEAFVREEEVADLDRVGSIMERIVAAHPDEVFVIEGHTDAVGSDAYNLKLSKLRAGAIKDVLLEFYNINESNITTVGLGERYLKIPTPDPEQENRRGTIRRVTPLVAGYDLEE